MLWDNKINKQNSHTKSRQITFGIDRNSQPQEYPYCHAEYLKINQNAIFSNGDLLLRYTSNFINLDTNLNLNGLDVLVKIDSVTGKTVWGKSIVFEYNKVLIGVDQIRLHNDVIYCFIQKFHNQIYFVLISKVDANGHLIESFSVINNPYQALESMLYFVPEFFLVADDESLFIISETIYSKGILGVSERSQTDITLFKYDSSFSLNWACSIDFSYQKEMVSSLKSHKNSLLVSLNIRDNTFCVISLHSTNGQIISSSWIEASNYYSSDGVGRFKLNLVTENLIFGFDLNDSK